MRAVKIEGLIKSDHHLGTDCLDPIGDMIDDDVIVHSDLGVIIHTKLDDETLQLGHKLCSIVKSTEKSRSNGLSQRSAVFGVLPRVPHRNDYCRLTRESYDQKDAFAMACLLANRCTEIYKKHLAESYSSAMDEISVIDESWRILNGPYQTININQNHAIRYHRDKGNFDDALSSVLIIKKDCDGGHLVCPELGITLKQSDGALTFFSGRNIVHGVTPLMPLSDDATRNSIVFYSMKGLSKCLPRHEEIERAKISQGQKDAHKYSKENRLKIIRMNKSMLKKKGSYLIDELGDE